MNLYEVMQPQIHRAFIHVEADSPEDAIERVRKGEGDEVDCEYWETVDVCQWTAEEVLE